MNLWKTCLRHAVLSLLCSAGLLNAAEKLDLERLTPVPAGEEIPIADFFRPTLFRDPKINPSGTHIAALISVGDDRYQLLAYDIASGKMEGVGGTGNQDIHEFTWLTDKRVLFGLSSRKLYGLGHYATEIGRFGSFYPVLQYYGSRLISVPRENRTKPLIWASHDSSNSGKDLGVVVVNTNIKNGAVVNLVSAGAEWSDMADARDGNDARILDSFPVPKGGMTVNYLADKKGELAFAVTAKDGLFQLQRWRDKQWVPCAVDLEKVDVMGVGENPGEIVVLTERQAGKPRGLRFMNAETGELGTLLLEDPDYDFNGWLYRDPVSQVIVGAVYERNGPHVVWFNEGYRTLQKVLNGFFPGQVVRLIGSDEAGKVFLVVTFSDRQPAVYHWVNLEKKTVGLIKNSTPWIDPKRMQAMNTMKYKTRDGKSLDAYLTLPAGASKKTPPPLVVLPHGGPWVRDSWGYNGEVQFLASRGYAVLQPNFRGSTGYSWMFPEEDEYAFRKMHDDVTDCVKAVLASGYVDRSRVAIMGASFGGYLALSGVAHEPELYRCAVTIAGVFDWAAMIKDSKYFQHSDPRYAWLRRKLGDPAKQTEKFAEISPLRHVDNVRVPVFVSHGKDDRVVGIAESKRLISELNRRDIPNESFFVSEEGHGMGHVKNNVELYGRIESFLEKHLAPAKTVAAATPAP